MPAKCFGPYLSYAIATHFRNFEVSYSYDDNHFKLLLLVEFKEGVNWKKFTDAMTAASFDVYLGYRINPAEKNSRYATVHCKKKAVGSGAVSIWEKYASRVELSLPMKEAEAKLEFDRSPQLQHGIRRKILMGVLDDGCPFAADRFLRTDRDMGTRVWAIWDQNREDGGVAVKDKYGVDCRFGEPHRAFVTVASSYGRPPMPKSKWG
jgi:hypothetical protein